MRDDGGMPGAGTIHQLAVGVTLVVALLGGGGLALLAPPTQVPHAEIVASPMVLAPFALSSPSGAFTEADLVHGWSLVFSGYTNCPDVCPTTLAQLAKAARGTEAPVRVVFATMDPARDDLSHLASYAAHFGDFVVPVTGSTAALTEFTDAFGLLRPGQVSPFDADVVAHSPTVVIVAPGARIAARVREPSTNKIIATLDQLRSQS